MAAYNLVNSAGKTLSESNAAGRTNFGGTTGVETIIGTDGANYFAATGGADTLIGGKGDDIYCVGVGDTVIEKAGEGIDTVYSYVTDYTLVDNVENLYVAVKDSFGGGNALDNFIKGADGRQTLDGGAGNDILMGGAGADTFVVRAGNGSDTINDFSAKDGDILRLDNYGFYSFSDIQARLSQSGADTILQLSATETLTFKNLKVADLGASSFFLPTNLSDLKLTFADEFNGLSLYDANTGTGTWRTILKGGNDPSSRSLTSNGEMQIYMDANFAGTGKTALGVNPFEIVDGKLIITATEASAAVSDKIWGYDYTSGLITTKMTFAQQYGYFEMRADLPDAEGVWPAFWLLAADGSWPPEIDVFEGLGDDNVVHMTQHTKETGTHTQSGGTYHVYDNADGYHTYGILWTAETLTWYIDGAAVKQVATPADMHKPMYMLANMAVGGWAGTPEANLDAKMGIDYIHVYSLDQLNTPTGPVTTPPTTPVPTPVPPVVTQTNFKDTAGNDVFNLKSVNDTISGTGGGLDTVYSLFSWTLQDGIENMVLNGTADATATGNGAANKLIGNSGNSTLIGLGGNDILMAGSGVTKMVGGTGNDTYYVTHTNDIIVELADEGTDTVKTTVSYTLSANIENMDLSGSDDLVGTGNESANRIYGNEGNSTLIGLGGNDTLIAGAGVAKMVGGEGNDVYIVAHSTDVVVEKAGEGTDSVQAGASFVLSANVENLSLTGTGNIDGTGNELANRVFGNDGKNVLKGMAGNDVIYGGKGDDKLYGGAGADTFTFKSGDGRDFIFDFSAKDNDKIDLSAMHAKATAIISQIGADVLISFGDGQTITVLNQTATNKDFLSHITW